jgi:dipeptidase E
VRLFLGSGGLSTDERRAAWREELGRFLGPVDRVLFVPYAIKDHDFYVQRMVELDFASGRHLDSVHRAQDPRAAVEAAAAVYVGGGNTFLLLKTLQDLGLLEVIRRRVRDGAPYVGISAGTNLACPTVRTTNDMPVVVPKGLDALGLVPFQINPHYFAGKTWIEAPGGYVPYGGESRDDRLREFLEWNDVPVLAPWEGGSLRVENGSALVLSQPARLFRRGADPHDYAPGSDVGFLLRRQPEA